MHVGALFVKEGGKRALSSGAAEAQDGLVNEGSVPAGLVDVHGSK